MRTDSTRMRFGFAAVALLATLASVGCSNRNPDINRVLDPYWPKDYFQGEWYQRTTVVDAPPEAGWVSIADGDWLMLEKLTWEITENSLIGWRTYPLVPGSNLEGTEGRDDIEYRGQPVAMYLITDHFDVRRSFDTLSGEEGNEIVENRDRLWYDRAFMRVDWSRNLVPTYKFHINLVQGNVGLPPGQSIFANGVDDVGNPKRWRFEPEAFEVTTRDTVYPDIYALYGFYGAGYGCLSDGKCDLTDKVIDIRHHYMKVPKSDYEPLAMPPTVVLEDENGNEVREQNGQAVRVPIGDRFGFFGTLGRATFDANRGIVSSGQVFNASRFNIWERHFDDQGRVIPTDQREPKPIVYYTNVEHPRSLMNGSKRVAAGWNHAFRDMIAKVQPQKYTADLDETGVPADVPEMFILRENSCNVANVETVLSALPGDIRGDVVKAAARDSGTTLVESFDGTIESVRARLDAANSDETPGTFTAKSLAETKALNDLERICSALEYYTAADITTGRPAPEGVARFTYQRLGDTRYSMLNLIPGDFQAGWLGLGPPYADPITGETISATANIALPGLDASAARAAQWISVLNGEITQNDFTNGFDISDYVKEKILESNELVSRDISDATSREMDRRFASLRGRNELLRELPPGREGERMRRLEGTHLEQMLITNDDVMAFGGLAPGQAAGAALDDDLMELVSPLRSGNKLHQHVERNKTFTRMGQRAMDPPEMIDDLLIGRALALRDLSYEERFKRLREDIYVAVQLHEVGHNVGMFHNMAGSADAINFGETFWQIQQLNPDMDEAITQLAGQTDDVSVARVASLEECIRVVAELGTDAENQLDPDAADMTTQDCLRQGEGMYSSIMDYHANWNADVNGLGPYDLAAVKFAYGQLVEVFPEENLTQSYKDEVAGLSGLQATRAMRKKLKYNDWRDIPVDIVDGADKLYEREYVKMDWTTSSTRQQPLFNEVPYKFGYGAQITPDEKPFDFGPDFRTNAANQLTRYNTHYFFSHFARDRVWDFNIDGAINNDLGVMLDFTEKMQWYFFYKATDPDFAGSYLEEDMLATTVTGLNLFSHIIGTPGAGFYHTFPKADVFGLTNEPTSERTMDSSDILLPWSSMGTCESLLFNEPGADENPGVPAAGYSQTFIDLGDGRPFFLGFTDDLVETYLRYVGTFWSKSYAIQLLGWNYAYFPRADGDADPRLYDVSWYRVFPNEVNKVFHSLITDQFADLGYLVDPEGNVVKRDLIAVEGPTSTPQYPNHSRIYPSIAFNHQYNALAYANIYMSSNTDDTFDMPKTMTIALEGGEDDMSAFDRADPADVATFTHPVSGLTLRALRVGETPIAFDLVNRMNVLSDRFQQLDQCARDAEDSDPATDSHITNSYCHCFETSALSPEGDALLCTGTIVERAPGEGTCTVFGLRNRRDSAQEILDDAVDYANDMRSFNRFFSL